MARRKKTTRSHKVTMEIPEKKYKRWRVEDEENRVITIDFRCIRTTPWQPIDYGANRVYLWNNPQQLQGLVDEYFASCYGPIRNPKTGEFYQNSDGSLVVGQIKPFTISGLALYCHIDTDRIKEYSDEKIDALGMPTDEDYVGLQYSDVMREARKRIEAYAEEQLYSRDGFGGGKFVLDAAFNWLGKRDQAEIKNLKKQTALKKKELQFRKDQAALGTEAEEPVTITIRRAGE